MNYIIKEVHKECIRVGDTIICPDGQMRTVCRNNIKRSGFMGLLIFGDCYKCGYQKVKKVQFIVATCKIKENDK